MSSTSQQPSPPQAPPIEKFTEQIPFEQLKLSSQTLGSGSYGTVYKATWFKTTVAVKEFRNHELNSFRVEVKQLSGIEHRNIVRLYGASTSPKSAYLVMEYAEQGSLNHLLHEDLNQTYDLRHACNWATQAAEGVAYLHAITPKPIMHRDLKPANLLLFQHGKILKICDFGTACAVRTEMTSVTGSAPYMAPEVFSTDSYKESGDVYSWSIVFWEILARKRPYTDQYNQYQLLWHVKEDGLRPSEFEDCPVIIWELITKSWNKDPKERPKMSEIASKMRFIYSFTGSSSRGSHHRHRHHSHHHQSRSSRRVSETSSSSPITPMTPSPMDPSRAFLIPQIKLEQNGIDDRRRDLIVEYMSLKNRLEVAKRQFEFLTLPSPSSASPTESSKMDAIDESDRLIQDINGKKDTRERLRLASQAL